jgi:uncharacterized protein (DUF779 family)
MKVDATNAARQVVERALAERTGALTITIGNGCCESTAPFLYEDYWPGPDAEAVGEVAGVVVYAPEHLRRLYPGDDGATIDVIEIDAESMSLETAWGQRLILRGHGVDTGTPDNGSQASGDGTCTTASRTVASFNPDDPDRPGARVRGELPEVLRNLRVR